MTFSKLLAVLVLLYYTAGVLGAEVKRSIIGSAWPRKIYLNITSADGSKGWYCDGALFDNQWVVTAAHCLDEDPKPDMKQVAVWIGSYWREEFESKNIWLHLFHHYNYNTDSGYEHDIVLLKLSEKVEYSENIAPISLPGNDRPIDPLSICWITGPPMERDFTFQGPETIMVSIKRDVCCPTYYAYRTPDLQCVGNGAGHKGACDEDYGGPLVCRGPRGHTLVPVMGYEGPSGCRVPGRPAVYAQVSSDVYSIDYYINLPDKASADV